MPPVLTLICPNLPAQLQALRARNDALSSWPSLGRLLERGSARAGECTHGTHLEQWQFQLLAAVGLDANQPAYASAPVSWLADGGSRREGVCLHADPVHLVAGMDHVQLTSTVALSVEESQAMFQRVAQLSTADAEFSISAQGNWYLWGRRELHVETRSPQRAAQSRLDDAMPTGPDGRVLRALMSEVQMTLHDHPVNRARERRQLLSANAIWLWGQGMATDIVRRSLPAICADYPYARGLACLHEAAWQPLAANGVELLRGLQQDTVVIVSSADLHELEHQWIAPLMNERKNYNVECNLLLPGWSIRMPRSGWLGSLQRRRSFEEFLN
jgi:hypothetical protein